MEKVKKVSVIYKILSLMKHRMWLFIIVMIFDVILTSICFNTYQAFLMKDIANATIQGDMYLLMRGIILGVVALLIGIAILPIIKYIKDKCILKTMCEIKVVLYKKLTNLSMSEFENKHSGEFLYRITNQIDRIQDVYYSLNNILFAGVYGGIAIICMFILDWKIALIIIILDLIQTFIDIYFVKPIRAKSEKLQESEKSLVERTVDLIDGNISSRILGIQNIVFDKFNKENNRVADCVQRQANVFLLHNSIIDFYSNTKYFGLLIIGIFMVFHGNLEVGVIIAMLRLQNDSRYLFGNIGNFITGIQDPLVGAREVFKFLDITNDENEYETQVIEEHSINNTDIKYENVSFKYNNESINVIEHIDLDIKHGDKIALVGQSGSGKSTIAKLLLGFYQVQEGNILINNYVIQKYTLRTLRDIVAYVPQNAYLFYGTIDENIKYGLLNADTQQVITAAKLANAHEFIIEQPDGYQTIVGEGGASLSGGQRQRIAIARAILKNAPILLLDEATSSLDSDSEQSIQEALNTLMAGKTTIIIAHRLSTVVDSDKIYVMENGRILEYGNHKELLNLGGLYTRLYMNSINETARD